MDQKTKKAIAAGLSVLLFFWYYSPAMTALRSLPEGVAPGEAVAAAPFVRVRARPVRTSGDERLAEEERTYALFGVVPLKTVR